MPPKEEDDVANEALIDASPTKDFFISMLVRDIELVDAIADLVDNCVDGARRTRPNGNYSGLWVRMDANTDKFRIADNCGGIPVDLARNYAFRFGRPTGMKATKHSVGQFGIGMKRALFKLGRHFTVESVTTLARFRVVVDVEKWRTEGDTKQNGVVDQKQDRWTFEFADPQAARVRCKSEGKDGCDNRLWRRRRASRSMGGSRSGSSFSTRWRRSCRGRSYRRWSEPHYPKGENGRPPVGLSDHAAGVFSAAVVQPERSGGGGGAV